MILFIIRRIISGILLGLFMVLFVLWMIEQIPGSYVDIIKAEDPNDNSLVHTTNTKEIPLFYFSILPLKVDPLISNETQSFWPDPRWNGLNNKYHLWMTQSQYSVRDQRPVSSKIYEAFGWTMCVQLPAIILIFGLGIYLGFWSVKTSQKKLPQYLNFFLTGLHSVPVFWIASLLLLVFCNPNFIQLFPSTFISDQEMSPINIWFRQPQYLILPLISLVLPSLAILYNMTRQGLIDQQQKPFWFRALSVGLSQQNVLKKEVLPLALIPVLGWIASALPFLIGGSIVIETIFSIPGTGRLLFQSIYYRDWTVVQALFMWGVGMTILGMLLADVCQRVYDPRLEVEQ